MASRDKLMRIASQQQGVVSLRDIRSSGVSDRTFRGWVQKGVWIRVYQGVYRTPGPSTFEQGLWAAVLWGGRGTVVSHRGAAYLLGLTEDQVVEITSPKKSKPPPSMEKHTGSPRWRDVRQVDGLPLTGPERTLIDLGAVLDPEGLEATFERAIRKGSTSMKRIEKHLRASANAHRPGVGRLKQILEARGRDTSPSESVLETKFERLLRNSGYPRPTRQYEVTIGGRVVARLDFAYPEQRLAIELDGFAYHSGRQAWQRDLRRQNLLIQLGWKILRFTWADVCDRPSDVLASLNDSFRQDGDIWPSERNG